MRKAPGKSGAALAECAISLEDDASEDLNPRIASEGFFRDDAVGVKP